MAECSRAVPGGGKLGHGCPPLIGERCVLTPTYFRMYKLDNKVHNSYFLREDRMTTVLRIDRQHALAGDHRQLLARVQCLQHTLTAAGLSNLQAEAELRQLERELDQHFADKESAGLFAEILAQCPQFGRRVQSLVRQHHEFRTLVRGLRSTCRLACCESPARDGWLAAFADFQRTLADHEHAEHELLCEATERDLGAGDSGRVPCRTAF